MSQSEGIFESRGGMSIRYRREGAGDPVVLVHGVGANLESWDAIAERLASHYTVLRADLRGHGKSGRMTDCEMSDFVSDVFALADHQGLTNFALVGFSLGGLIAQCCALEAPDRLTKLVLISTVAQRTPEERTRVIERTKLLASDGVRAVTGAAAERWFTPEFKARNPERVAQRLEELAANDPKSYLAAYRVFGLADEGLPLSDIRTPTFIMTGEDDPGSNPRMSRLLHEEIKGSKVEILPGLRHSVLLETPDLVADRIERFLAQ
ncbi:alpha/beta fold hydrolase [Bosea sp. NBC_00550]|uniref:alpha/beta fold hydrolase n=1 Tax=Bosea sp. NBC_00550 TaxID=2969621 RepID=UPI002231478D|nr:alpha/beta fold hydrolase [Bosea sp. NBC_00550]UZF95547.1 alpha/beta fold hydrolase [Bosea sp. NBC_00550]